VRALLGLLLLAAQVAGQAARPDLDAVRLRGGDFHYRTLVDGQEAGRSRIQIRKSDSGDFVFMNRVEGAFSQSWESVASPTFEPILARLKMGRGRDARTVFELVYRGGRVTGFASSGKGPSVERRSVDDAVAEDTVDQRIDWAAVMAVKEYAADARFAFHVYDPGTGLSRVTARVVGFERVTVPAGTFSTARVAYTIEKSRGSETYEVFVHRELPRFLVKEIFPNGAVTELVVAEPGTSVPAPAP
jgi:hypothetical protein